MIPAVGIDVGGTFTDIALVDASGRLWVHKCPSSHGPEPDSVISGLNAILRNSGVRPAELAEVVHATTVCTNAVLERSGPRIGLITTEGFRDVLEIARIRTPSLYNLKWSKPTPLVARRDRYEVRERIGARGEIVKELDEGGVRTAASWLRKSGIADVAVCLINSPINHVHELRIRDIVLEYYPGANITLSVDVFPELKEYERTSTTVVNAYLRPIVGDYLQRLEGELRNLGVIAPLSVVRSDGGKMSAAAARDRPVEMVISGPAAGVSAVQRVSERIGLSHVISFDMGGTTAKAALIQEGRIPRVSEYEVRDGMSVPSRFIKAGGYLLMAPAVDLAEVGNGAGSIARVDAGGALRIGPESAGAVPGPACYGRGGVRPTVTDANVLLGYLNESALVDGAVRLDRLESVKAIERLVAKPLGLESIDAAWGVYSLANANMLRAVRSVTVERGRDVRDFALVAFGGSGPVHAAAIARELGVNTVVVPRSAGVLSAIGLLVASPERHVSRAWKKRLFAESYGDLISDGKRLGADARAMLEAEGIASSKIEVFADLRYSGQSSVSTIDLKIDGDDGGLSRLIEEFELEYSQVYGHLLGREAIEVVAIRAAAGGWGSPVYPEATGNDEADKPRARNGCRRAYFGPQYGYFETPVVSRPAVLMAGELRNGPLLVDEYDTTVVVPPDFGVRGAASGALRLERI